MNSAATNAARKPLPRWVVLAAVLISGGITAWAMWATGLRGPHQSWDQAQGIVEQVWPGEHDSRSFQAWGSSDSSNGTAARTVAALPGVPSIVWGAQRTHADRGVCTNCHAVVSPQGVSVPSIRSFSSMTHEYRGVCVNCHQITLAPNPMGLSVAQTAVGTPASPQAVVPPQTLAPPPPPRAQPTEGEWKGLEVAPTPQGVGVAGTEGEAARVGVLQGDVITSVNATPILSMTDFVQATQNGTLARGTLIVTRANQRLAFELGQAPAALPALPPPPNPNAASPLGGAAERRF